jgi:hypothetical protein
MTTILLKNNYEQMKILIKFLVYILAGIATVAFLPIFLYAWTFLGIFRPNISINRRFYNTISFFIMTAVIIFLISFFIIG